MRGEYKKRRVHNFEEYTPGQDAPAPEPTASTSTPTPTIFSTSTSTRDFNRRLERKRAAKAKQVNVQHTVLSVGATGTRTKGRTLHATTTAPEGGPSAAAGPSTSIPVPATSTSAQGHKRPETSSTGGGEGFNDDNHGGDDGIKWLDEDATVGNTGKSRRHLDPRNKGVKRKRPIRKNPLLALLKMIGLIIDCSLRHDRLGDRALDPRTGLPACDACTAPGANLRCRACLFGRVLCKDCILSEHQRLPLHNIDRWNKDYWVSTSLSKLGLCIQLGHAGAACKRPLPQEELIVIDVSGIHSVNHNQCGCYEDPSNTIPITQLLGIKWWPATADTPGTVMTDDACHLFQAQTLQGKVNAYDFWNGLLRITDSSGLRTVKPRYPEMHRITKVFRYHRVLKRAGVGHQARDLIIPSTGRVVISGAEVNALRAVAEEAAAAEAPTVPDSRAGLSSATSNATPSSETVSPSSQPGLDTSNPNSAGPGAADGPRNGSEVPASSATSPSNTDASFVFLAIFTAALTSLQEERSQSNEALIESFDIPAIEPGSLAIRCPSCPNEDNMSDGWQDAEPRERYKHQLYISSDANFKLRRKAKINVRDVPMGDGGLFFVEEEAYQEHLVQNPSQQEMKECRSSHTAVTAADKVGDERYDINGIGALLCARHLFYFPCSIADLRFGERYVSMDYILFVMLRLFYSHILWLFFTYDIACQFSKNIISRWDKYGTEFKLDAPGRTMRCCVPKFHLPAHGEDCIECYNLNYTHGSGRTCGEGIEGSWANTNGAALMTREMGPHTRHFSLNGLFQSINWQKLISLGAWMAKGLRTSVKQYAIQKEVLEDLEATFPPETIQKWRIALRAWEDDFGESPNPFHEEHEGLAATNVHLEPTLETHLVSFAPAIPVLV